MIDSHGPQIFLRRQLAPWRWLALGWLLVSRLFPSVTYADSPTQLAQGSSATSDVFFRQHVLPILQEHCFQCHSHGAERIRGGLLLDSSAAMKTGGDHGPVVVPGKPELSRLLIAVMHSDPDLTMPPKSPRLQDELIAVLRTWIQAGAVWPADAAQNSGAAMKSRPRGSITQKDREWWAFQPLKVSSPPADPSGWSWRTVDQFVVASLRTENLQPAPSADPRAFIRRVTFDLTGLPPSPSESAAFLKDCEAEQQPSGVSALPRAAVARLIDRLLASPAYGERSARLWLDLVRYAESDGYRVDDYRPHVWRYRDWVIESMNADLPYDKFVQAQLAGDELWPDEPTLARVAPSFLRHGIYEYNNRDARGQWQTILNEVTDLTGEVFLGLGFQCARCHDHKFDPILQKDYFRLQSFFAAMEFRQDLVVATSAEERAYREQWQKWEEATAQLREELRQLEQPYREKAREEATSKFPPDVQALLRDMSAHRPPGEELIARLAYRQITYEYDRLATKFKPSDKIAIERVQRLLKEYETLKPAPLPPAYTVSDIGPEAAPVRLPKNKEGSSIAPGFPTVLDARDADIEPIPGRPQTTGRRATLARWLTQTENPLVARVMVNRVWQQHFGRGLVSTSSDFGTLGDRPSHPELLDWLALRFISEGWSLKKLHREIVASATYAQSTTPSTEAVLTRDPENRWLARYPVRRLESEQIRDALLAVSGELRTWMGGPSEPASQPRRTIYTRIHRNTRDPLQEVFDAPENFSSTAQRNVTTTPAQSLLLLNGSPLLQRAQAFAQRLAKEASSDAKRISNAYEVALGRSPRPFELSMATRFLEDQPNRIPPHPPKDAGFAGERMAYREGQAAVLNPKSTQVRFRLASTPIFPEGDFTLETFALLRTAPERDSYRTIASRWDGSTSKSGWALAVTGAGHPEKPQTLVLRMGCPGLTNSSWVSSGISLELNKSYFLAVTVKHDDNTDDAVVFAIKEVANDCEPTQIIRARRPLTEPLVSTGPFAMGSLANDSSGAPWDGLLDDVRYSRVALPPERWLLQDESISADCVGWWRFEANPGAYVDLSRYHHDLPPPKPSELQRLDPRTQALADFCHVLLNCSEFLYTD